MKQLAHNRGMVLLLSVLIVASALAAALLFSNSIVREIKQARLIDQSLQSFYIAESGVERALYQARQREAVVASDCGLIVAGSACDANTGFCSGTNNSVSCIAEAPENLTLRGDWQVNVVNEQQTTVPLGAGGSFQLDLFSPFQDENFNTAINSFRISSDLDNSTDLYAEMTNLTWLIGPTVTCPLDSVVDPSPAISKGRVTLTLNEQTDVVETTGFEQKIETGPDIDPDCSYILRISNVLSRAPGQFTISIYDQNNEPLLIPSRLVINSSARFGNSEQRLRVHTPMRPPLSGLYDFVIFSEEQIVKQ